ncbi:flagellar basal body rod protein FlgB [Sulfitobacter sp.]|jgi:flagellar basal-body rod protein FlgB|uniref:flagellar basal body rod protein FlgB n=1 Tax=Sulfitobacter sp. TaxID=1903071 RepID=UPI001A09774E|nr:flagellar basal body rod protein FlgB [Sulfitobacter sp.]
MNLSNLSIFGLASDRMTWLAARQQVTSENIANSATPSFQARDVTSFQSMLDNQTSTDAGLVTTHANHISGRSVSTSGIREVNDSTATAATLDGNTVNLEDQAIRSADISDQYRMAAQLYRKSYDLLTMAVTGSR